MDVKEAVAVGKEYSMTQVLLRAFERYRDEDKHECNLITGRVNALLVSQAFFAAATSVIYTATAGPQKIIVIRLIIIVAFSTVFITSCGICIGCQVLREWHQHGMKLIDKDVEGELQGCFLSLRRNQPDFRHKISIDLLSIGIAVAVGIGWLYAFAMTSRHPPGTLRFITIVTGIGWLIALRASWILSKWPTPETCEGKIAAIFPLLKWAQQARVISRKLKLAIRL